MQELSRSSKQMRQVSPTLQATGLDLGLDGNDANFVPLDDLWKTTCASQFPGHEAPSL